MLCRGGRAGLRLRASVYTALEDVQRAENNLRLIARTGNRLFWNVSVIPDRIRLTDTAATTLTEALAGGDANRTELQLSTVARGLTR